MNRIPQENNEDDENLTEGMVVYPLISMHSMQPVSINSKSPFISPQELSLLKNDIFALNFSSFKRSEDGPAHVSFIVANLSKPEPPKIVVETVDDINGADSKEFLMTSLSHFEKFKKAILLYEDRPYTFPEFENTVEEWKKSLSENL